MEEEGHQGYDTCGGGYFLNMFRNRKSWVSSERSASWGLLCMMRRLSASGSAMASFVASRGGGGEGESWVEGRWRGGWRRRRVVVDRSADDDAGENKV